MKLEMEILSPSSYFSASNWLLEETESSKWTPAENKMFENALALHDRDTPDRWHKVAQMIPGKTVGDVVKQYKELEADVGKIEAGLVPIPGYGTSPFTLEWVNKHGYEGFKQTYGIGGKRGASARPADQERKKGVPWTEDEHKLFLMGLKKYGKGDWRNISRNFVVTRTPTQVASHAQKYFIRQHSGGKDKRRASIHDITTVNLSDTRTPSPDNKPLSPDHCHSAAFSQPNSARIPPFQWHQGGNGTNMAFGQAHGNMFMSNSYGIGSYGLNKSTVHESYYAPQNLAFQIQSAQHYPHG